MWVVVVLGLGCFLCASRLGWRAVSTGKATNALLKAIDPRQEGLKAYWQDTVLRFTGLGCAHVRTTARGRPPGNSSWRKQMTVAGAIAGSLPPAQTRMWLLMAEPSPCVCRAEMADADLAAVIAQFLAGANAVNG